MALSPLEIIMLVANIVFIIIAVFLFIRLRKIEKKPEPEIKQQTELSGIADITPVEFNRERFGIEEKKIPEPEKTMEAGEEEKIEASKIAELKLEDELPEVGEAPRKKRAAAKKEEMKVPEETVVEKQEVPPEKIEIPEKIEFKFEEKEPEKEEEKIEKKPEKKASKKKKPVKKEPAAKMETKQAPRKKPAKKKKSLIDENI
jgi:hypothetical protein